MTQAQPKPTLFDGAPQTAAAPKAKPAKVKTKTALIPPPEPQTAVTVVRNTPKNLVQVVREAAADKNCDATKMRMLLDMLKEVEDDEAKKAFTRAFMALQGDLPSIDQDSKIEIEGKSGKRGQRTFYASYNNIMKIVKPVLQKHGFTLAHSTEPVADGTRIIVKSFLDHQDGHQRTTAFPLPAETSGSKNNVQGWGSSSSYGKRYNTIALLNIISHAPRDADLNGNTGRSRKEIEGNLTKSDADDGPPKITAKQEEALVDAIEACGVGRPKFCQHYVIAKIVDLPASLYDEAMKACSDFKARKVATNG